MSGSVCVNVCVPFLFFLNLSLLLRFSSFSSTNMMYVNQQIITASTPPPIIRSVVFKPPVITSVWCCILTHVNVVDPLLFQTAQSMGADADEGGVARTEIFRMAGMCGAPANHGEDAHKDSQNHHDLCLREEKL